MAETTIIKENGDEPTEKAIDMAVEFGALREAYRQNLEACEAIRQQQQAQGAALAESQRMLAELYSRSAAAEVKADVAVAIAEEAAEEAEEAEEEEEGGTLVVTPEPEIIEEVKEPVPERHWIHNLIYGSK